MSDFEPSVAVRARTSAEPPAAHRNRFERWVLGQLARGRVRFISLTALIIMAVSAGLTAALIHPAGLADKPGVVLTSAILAGAVSGLVAPPILWYLCLLIAGLDQMTVALHRAAITDPLTQVLNRRGFFDAVASVNPGSRPWMVAMVDLDDFKILNDTHGHDVGDQILSLTARWLVEHAGDHGFVGRIGGDEFACVCPELPDGGPGAATGPIGARRTTGPNPTLSDGHHRFQTGGVPFSVSVGRAPVVPGESIPDALLHADVALYRTKHARPDQSPRSSPATASTLWRGCGRR
ncbi:MAG: GGDEF domain-containing protein [Acidimicrobiales bacterium]